METKKCTKCGEEKELSKFHKRKSRPCGYVSRCKKCTKVYYKVYSETYIRTSAIKLRKKEYDNSLNGKFASYKSGAKRRGLRFDLTMEEFKTFWQKPCTFCGSEIETIGLDRKNSSEGYILDNVAPCCSRCNYLKRTDTVEDFFAHILKIIKFSLGDRPLNRAV